MNDHDPRRQRQLELATSRQLPAGTLLDDETQRLRDDWLLFGQLLEQFSPAAPVAPPSPSPPRVPPDRRGRGQLWLGVTAGILAASLLVALGLGARLLPRLVRETAQHDPVSGTETEEGGVVPEADSVPSSAATDGNSTSDDLAWDDTLDQRLAAAQQQVYELQSLHYGSGKSTWGPLASEVEEFSAELQGENL